MEYSLTQLFDADAMNKLWNARNGLPDPQQAVYLDKLYKKRKFGNQAKITYKHCTSIPGQMKYGRLQGQPGAAILFERSIRGALFAKYYFDVDVVNCHPSILLHMMRSKHHNAPALAQYVENRDEFFAEFETHYNLSRDDVKSAVIGALYGQKISSKNHNDYPPIKAIADEINSFTATLMEHPEHQRLKEACIKSKKGNLNGTFLSWILQTEERNVMLALSDSLGSQSRSVDAFCHDGVMVRKNDKETALSDDLIRNAEISILQKTGYSLRLLVKPWDIMPLADAPLIKEDEDAYFQMKTRFESEHFWFVPTCSVCSKIDNQLQHFTKSEAIMNFGMVYKLNNDPKKFFNRWMIDPTRRTINRFVLKPDGRPDSFCLFNGFAYEDTEEEEDETVIGAFHEKLDHVTNRDEHIKQHILNWITHILQKPFEIPGTSVILTGDQGVGKDMLGNFIGRYVLGSHAFANYGTTRQFFDSHDTLCENKFLIKLEEAAPSIVRANADELKSRITSDTLTLNPKGKKPYTVQNFARIMMSANKDSPIKLENGDRRYVMVSCGSYNQGNVEFWKRISDILCETPTVGKRAGGIVGRWLYNRNIDDWNPRSVPMTELKRQVADLEIPPEVRFIKERWDGKPIRATLLFDQYLAFCSENGFPPVHSAISFGRRLIRPVVNGELRRWDGMHGSMYCKASEAPANEIINPQVAE